MKIEKGSEFVFDTFALIAFLQKEPGGKKVEKILSRAEEEKCTIYLNEINLGEVYYRTWKDKGEEIAKKALSLCLTLPIFFISANRDFILKAAEIKAKHKVSYADAFCVETARQKQCPIMTGDPEFLEIPDVKIVWINKKR